MQLKRLKFNTVFGYIDYSYLTNLNNYENGLIIVHGSIIYREYRGTGKFKEMLKMFLSKYPEGTVIQGAVITKKLTSMFERIGFKRVKKIEYWGSPANCKLVQGTLPKEMLDLL
jgi:hypothetical protein